MKAIIFIGDIVVGYHPNPNIEIMNKLGTQYDLVEVAPEIILNTPKDNIVIRKSKGVYELREVKPPQLTPEQQRIAQLESDNITIMLAIADLYEKQAGGGV